MAKKTAKSGKLGAEQRAELLETLKERFEANMHRHEGLDWAKVQKRLEAHADELQALARMEETGGEPDVVGGEQKGGAYLFFDCVAESPDGRRSVCYDPEALESRKKHKPRDSAVGMAAAWGAALLSEEQYRQLQSLGPVDTKTSSWLETPADIRELGGAIFGDYRYGTVFVYHNGAESYYSARGFRCVVRV